MNDQADWSYRAWPPPPAEDLRCQKNSQRPCIALADGNRSVCKSNKAHGVRGSASIGIGNHKSSFHSADSSRNQRRKKAGHRFVPNTPRNTTSFLIRAKKSGGIASLVSPCPVTPAVLPTPEFSPSREVVVDMGQEEWGVNGYGSMNGLIRLRSLGNDDDDEEVAGDETSDDIAVERRLEHDLSRFEMICPIGGLSRAERENLSFKERLLLMERDLEDMKRRIVCLERENSIFEVFHDASENDGVGAVSSEMSVRGL